MRAVVFLGICTKICRRSSAMLVRSSSFAWAPVCRSQVVKSSAFYLRSVFEDFGCNKRIQFRRFVPVGIKIHCFAVASYVAFLFFFHSLARLVLRGANWGFGAGFESLVRDSLFRWSRWILGCAVDEAYRIVADVTCKRCPFLRIKSQLKCPSSFITVTRIFQNVGSFVYLWGDCE